MTDGPSGQTPPAGPDGRTPAPAPAKKQRPRPPVLSKVPPAALVIFGASGDLTARKILPALARLADRGVLDDGFTLIGVARTEWSDDDFRSHVTEATPGCGPKWRSLTERFKYIAGEYDDADTFSRLKDQLDEADRIDGTQGNRVYYLATIPSVFGLVAQSLADHACTRPGPGGRSSGWWWRSPTAATWTAPSPSTNRCTPPSTSPRSIGSTTTWARRPCRTCSPCGSPTPSSNPSGTGATSSRSKSPWPRASGVEHRGGFYETAGALRDIVQNHVMQVLALTMMESPTSTDADRIRDEKVKLLHAIDIPTPDEAVDKSVRGQYTEGFIDGEKVIGYRQEPDVSPESETETYLALRLRVENWRWAGVPIFVRTGKRLPARVTEVALTFRQVPFLLFDHRTSRDLRPNTLILRIQPDEGISLEFGAKVPGEKFHIRSVAMDFSYAEAFAGAEAADGYERLIHDAMVGDATLFIRSDEVQQAWRIVDPYLQAWSEPGGAMHFYPAGTWGPHMADLLVERSGDEWRNPEIDLELSGGRLTELPQ